MPDALPAAPKPQDRLEQLGYARRRNVAPLTELHPRQLLLIDYMIHGCPHPTAAERIGVRAGQPLTLNQAADLLRIRRRNAHRLATVPAFQNALAKANAALRSGAHTKAIHRMIHLIDEPGEGKASDHKVQLDAARAVLGEDQAGANNPRVSVSIHNTVQTPGYVINVQPDTAPPDRPVTTIDLKPDP